VQRSVEDLEKRKTEENTQIQLSSIASYPAPPACRPIATRRHEKGSVLWLAAPEAARGTKIADTVSHFVTENPINMDSPLLRPPRKKVRQRLSYWLKGLQWNRLSRATAVCGFFISVAKIPAS
jgi:hypothetical protein